MGKILDSKLLHSINDFNEAKQVIPGGVNSPVRAFGSVGGTPRFIKRGYECFLIDEDDNKYIDFVQSYGPLILGHSNKEVFNAISSTMQNGLTFGAPTELESALAKQIVEQCQGIDMVRFVNSGTEATMSAIRLARAFSKKDDIVKFDGCYHGHSDSLLVKSGSGLATFGNLSSAGVPSSFAKHTLVATYNDIESFKQCLKLSDNIGCVIIEPIAGNMGLVPSEVEFLKELRSLCDKHNIVLILDEVMSGFRCDFKSSYKFYGITPDLSTYGKVVGGGMPLACFGGREDIMKLLSPLGDVYQAGTLSGNPLAVSAGLATLSVIKQDLSIYERMEKLALKFTKGFEEVAKKYNIPLRTCVRGSMFGFFFSKQDIKNFSDALKSDTAFYAKFHAKMLDKGVYFAPSQFESSFICTPMNEELIEGIFPLIDESFDELQNNC